MAVSSAQDAFDTDVSSSCCDAGRLVSPATSDVVVECGEIRRAHPANYKESANTNDRGLSYWEPELSSDDSERPSQPSLGLKGLSGFEKCDSSFGSDKQTPPRRDNAYSRLWGTWPFLSHLPTLEVMCTVTAWLDEVGDDLMPDPSGGTSYGDTLKLDPDTTEQRRNVSTPSTPEAPSNEVNVQNRSPQHLDSAIRLLEWDKKQSKPVEDSGPGSRPLGRQAKIRNVLTTQRHGKQRPGQHAYLSESKRTDVHAEDGYGKPSPSIWSGCRSPTKIDHSFSPEAQSAPDAVDAQQKQQYEIVVMSARMPSDEVDPFRQLLPDSRMLPALSSSSYHDEHRETQPDETRISKRVRFAGVAKISDQPLDRHRAGAAVTAAAAQSPCSSEGTDQRLSEDTVILDGERSLDPSVIDSPTLVQKEKKQIPPKSSFASSRNARELLEAINPQNQVRESSVQHEGHAEALLGEQSATLPKNTAERQDSLSSSSVSSSEHTESGTGEAVTGDPESSTPEAGSGPRRPAGIPSSHASSLSNTSLVGPGFSGSVKGRKASLGFGLDGTSKAEAWRPCSPKTDASIGYNHDHAFKGDSSMGRASLDKLKKSLKMTPIAKAGESVNQAIERVSRLPVPERPKEEDLMDSRSSRKSMTASSRSTLPKPLLPISSDSLADGERDVAHGDENVSPTDVSSDTCPRPAKSTTATSSLQQRNGMGSVSNRHRRSNAVVLSGEEAKRRKS